MVSNYSSNRMFYNLTTYLGCSSLKMVQISTKSSLSTIQWHAFESCTSLETIFIPDTVETIESNAFRGYS